VISKCIKNASNNRLLIYLYSELNKKDKIFNSSTFENLLYFMASFTADVFCVTFVFQNKNY